MTSAAAILRPDQSRILLHMLGITNPSVREPRPHRDYYCATAHDEPLRELRRLGMVELYSERDGYRWYRTTTAGRDAALASFRAMRWPKRKRMYARFLDIRDALPDLTFREFITSAQFADTRRQA